MTKLLNEKMIKLTAKDQASQLATLNDLFDKMVAADDTLETLSTARLANMRKLWKLSASTGLKVIQDHGRYVHKYCKINADKHGVTGSQHRHWTGTVHALRKVSDFKKTMRLDAKSGKVKVFDSNSKDKQASKAVNVPTPDQVKANDPANMLKEIKKDLAAYNKLADVKLTLQKSKK